MKTIGIIGASALGRSAFVETLIAALRFDGWSVSTIKRAPDGFDIDTPGKFSYARREAGCREVMLVGDARLVLMREFRSDPAPALESLIGRLEPVDIVIAEGFREAAVPTVEVFVPASGRAPRWPRNRHVVALVTDVPIAAPLPTFAVADVAGLADFIVGCLALSRQA
jgi:molybdopterin-guanine dinucleotide biosynthesis protein B